ncbi:uncharacterized protein LOC122058642 [Macadamia integrifolia]|uniref:uncharacterized protein LOC122058642 n=1 Tax=Macadamia integrifolia TaxID=60698 RepID=UPI001C52892F|nr:uncharacterized protein LOC122058642 [Macadamia integrifolia]
MERKSGFFKKLNKRSWPLRFRLYPFQWKRLGFQLSFVEDVLFKIVSVFEAIFLVTTLCFFYLCCGCHF